MWFQSTATASKANNDNVSEAGSDTSKHSSKSRKANFYYVDADGAEADTLKDKFWRNLEEGKINVFSNDMYSKVKNTGRSARPSSFKEVFQPSRDPAVSSEDDAQEREAKKRRVSKSTERKKQEQIPAESSSKKKSASKTSKTSSGKKAAASKKASKDKSAHLEEETPVSSKTKPQRANAQTARKRISRMLLESGSASSPKDQDDGSGGEESDKSHAEVQGSPSRDRAVSDISESSTVEEVCAEGMHSTTFDYEVLYLQQKPPELSQISVLFLCTATHLF